MKEEFVLRKGKVYPLSREKREEMREFIKEQLRKGYIRPSKSLQTVPVFFVGKKDGKKRIVKIIDNGLDSYFYFSFYFILFYFFFYSSIFRTTWVRVYQSCCHISHELMA